MGNSGSAPQAPVAAQIATTPPAQAASVPQSAVVASQRSTGDISAEAAHTDGGNKDEARLSRMTRSNSIKEKIFQEWQKHCMKECDMDVRRYWVCRQEQTWFAPVKCAKDNDVMKQCLQTCARDTEAFNAYRSKRLDDIEAEILARHAAKENR